jgi:hypothetical protein
MVPEYLEKEDRKPRWWKELKQLGPFFFLAALVLIPDKASSVVLFSTGVMSLVLVLSHLARKALFPYLDMSTLFKIIYSKQDDHDDPTAAALVILGVLGLYGVMIWGMISLLR